MRTVTPTARMSRWLLLALLAGCDWRPGAQRTNLAQNVGESFATCNETEIKFLAAKHNVQLVFRPCGNNAFASYSWAPDGLKIYFQLVLSAYVMDADAANKATTSLPLPTPTGEGIWMSTSRVVVPVHGDHKKDPVRLAMFQLPGAPDEFGLSTTPGQLNYHPLPGLTGVGQLQRGDSPTELFFTARVSDDSPLSIYRIDLSDGSVSKAFDWLLSDVTTFTYTPEQHTVVIGHNKQVVSYRRNGEQQGMWDHANRGVMQPEGNWMALEYAGPETSPFFQRTWDEISDAQRRREQARATRFEEGMPNWLPRSLNPPMLSVVQLSTGDRWVFTAFLGDKMSWYSAAEGWMSFFLWGFEGKQFKRNVGLVNMKDRLLSIQEGRPMMGVERFDAKALEAPTAE